MSNVTVVSYTDDLGREYTETSTSPGMAVIREEELRQAGYVVD